MVDSISKEQRSLNMSKIKAGNTGPELIVRRIAHRLGFRFRLYRKDLPGTPDLVFPKHRLVIFVHGCFWHRHNGCKFAYTPKSNIEYWNQKFDNNTERDRRTEIALINLGWRVRVIWECQTKDSEVIERLLHSFLSRNGGSRADDKPNVFLQKVAETTNHYIGSSSKQRLRK